MSQSNKPTGESKPQPVLMKNPLGVKVACVNFHVFPPETQKPKALTSGLNLFGRRLNLWRRYQIYIKYSRFNPVLQSPRRQLLSKQIPFNDYPAAIA